MCIFLKGAASANTTNFTKLTIVKLTDSDVVPCHFRKYKSIFGDVYNFWNPRMIARCE